MAGATSTSSLPAGRDDGPHFGSGDGRRQFERPRVRQELDCLAIDSALLVDGRAASTTCKRRRSAAMPTALASTSKGRSASSPSSGASATPTASLQAKRPTDSICPRRPTERRKARPATPPPATSAARSAPRSIKKLTVKPANQLVQTAQNPDFVQLQEQGYPTYVASPGYSTHQRRSSRRRDRSARSTSLAPSSTPRSRPASTTRRTSTGSREPEAPARSRPSSKGRPDQSPVLGTRSVPANNHYDKLTGTAGPGQITYLEYQATATIRSEPTASAIPVRASLPAESSSSGNDADRPTA